MSEETNTDKIEQALTAIGAYLKDAMIVELALQGHKATGQLIDSLTNKVENIIGSVRLTGEFALYGKFVDLGRSRGTRKVPIDALMAWIIQKGFETDAKKVKGMAFAIQKTIFDKGISQPQSWAGDSTKDWMTKTLTNSEEKINADIQAAVDLQMDIIIGNLVTGAREQAQAYGIAA